MTIDSVISLVGDLSPASDAQALKRAYSCFPSGVVAVSSRIETPDGDPILLGMAASAFTTVSLAPPLVSLCVQNSSTTWPRLRSAPASRPFKEALWRGD